MTSIRDAEGGAFRNTAEEIRPVVRRLVFAAVAVFALCAVSVSGGVYNLKVVTDASPDYYDMESMIRSITGRWDKPSEKCWALFYWNHIARRQTSPVIVHGVECTDPIRQFNDYGYTMCSTVAGINCSIWEAMGYPVKFWDISNHTVCEVGYDGRWHMYDNSMSAIYTLCDGVTIAGVEDIGKAGGCALSGGRIEPGHIAKYHCLNANSPRGFLTGADCARDLDQEYRCFNPNGLKYRAYYNNQDLGHRYILNLRGGETYTRYYHSLGDSREFYVPNNGKDPESVNRRYGIRGNGVRTFAPVLSAAGLEDLYSFSGCRVIEPAGLVPAESGSDGEAIFKIQGANVITSMLIKAAFERRTDADGNHIAVSTTNGLTWKEVWTNKATGPGEAVVNLIDEVNGTYEVLVKVTLAAKNKPEDACLNAIEFKTTTMLNSKTQPKLLLGSNTVYVGLGEQTDSIVLRPDLRAERYEPYVVDQRNVASKSEHPGYQGVLHAAEAGKDAYVVFRLDAPGDIKRLTYGGRFYNRAPHSHIDLLHSFDGGKSWQQSYSLTKTDMPWDVIHFETVEAVPPGVRSVLLKYLLSSPQAGTDSCSIYSVRMEADYVPRAAGFEPVEVTFNWSEVQEDYCLVERSHTQLVTEVPFKYAINVGGCDHPVVNSMLVNPKGSAGDMKYGYSDGRDAGGVKYVPKWVSCGRNLALGSDYSVSTPSMTSWGAGDPEGNKLTDGVMGPPYAGGIGPGFALCWDKGMEPVIDVDLGRVEQCGAFRIHLSAGWPWWDAMKGQVRDAVEVLTSTDNREFRSVGFFALNLRWKDIPINHMMPDDETATGFTYSLISPSPVDGRYVRFKITPQRTVTVSEVQVLDRIESEPFDLRIALPD
ncbi:MAG: hypothetical protein JW720_09205 [Sedimentisphaerales bacterium]|nr:hypothetical protein [Sedimentisphaerales bacterium]